MKLLFNSYRIDQYSDPESFKNIIGLVLEQYPIETIKFVTDPRTGVQRRCTFPPSVKEVADACDNHLNHLAKIARFKNWGNGNDRLLEPPRESKPTREEMLEKYGPNWGITDPGNERLGTEAKPAPKWERIVEQYHGDPDAMKRLTAPWMTRD